MFVSLLRACMCVLQGKSGWSGPCPTHLPKTEPSPPPPTASIHAVLVEYQTFVTTPPVLVPSVLLANALTAFALNLAVFLLIGKTSALTMNIAGVIKDWMLIFFSYYLFHAPVTALNLAGYAFCVAGVAVYNYQKLQVCALLRKNVGGLCGSGGDCCCARRRRFWYGCMAWHVLTTRHLPWFPPFP